MTILNNERIRNEQLLTEMKLLQARYHPHFLFNMLNTVYFRINEDNQEARETVEHLSNLLRGQLYPENGKVTLEKELSVMESYIELSRLRFDKKLCLNKDIKNYSDDVLIYPYLLLPLVENAFKHLGDPYQVDINLRCDGDTLRLEINNTVSANAQIASQHTGIGLPNLKRRLQLFYGDDNYTLDLSRNGEVYNAKLMIRL